MFSSAVFAQHDQYGKWKWDKYGDYWLKSSDSYQKVGFMTPTTLRLFDYKNGIIHLSLIIEYNANFEVIDQRSHSNNSSEIYDIVEIPLSFDDGETIHLKFERSNKSVGDETYGICYDYIVYDRLKKTANMDATNILKQMAEKKKLTVQYKLKNGSTRTKTFYLEGLEAILESIK